jgi:hypothetical protein
MKIKDYSVGTASSGDLVTISDGTTGATKNVTVDNLVDMEDCKIYRAFLTQTGTSAPIATVVGSNTIGNIVWTRAGVGSYVATLSGAFNTTTSFVTSNVSALVTFDAVIATNTITIAVYSDGGQADEWLINQYIEIKVYTV